MEYKVIKTDNYLFAVEDKDFVKGSRVLLLRSDALDVHVYHRELICIVKEDTGSYLQVEEYSHIGIRKDLCRKILAHRPLNGAPYLDGTDVLPPNWQESDKEDIEELANKLTNHLTFPEERREGIVHGYNIAKEKYKYTEEEYDRLLSFVKKIHDEGYDPYDSAHHLQVQKYANEAKQIIQSLQHPEVVFECEMKQRFEGDKLKRENPDNGVYYTPKTIINSENRTEWVGKYLKKVS
jgi:hypothetical protein